MNCWDCGSFNSSLAEACEECGAPLDEEQVSERTMRRRKARGVAKRRRQKIKGNQRGWASVLLGLGLLATPLAYLYQKHEAYSALRRLGMSNARVMPDLLGWVLLGATCALVLAFSSAKRAWLVFGAAVVVGGAGFISSLAKAGIDWRVVPSMLLLSLSAYLLRESLKKRSGRGR